MKQLCVKTKASITPQVFYSKLFCALLFLKYIDFYFLDHKEKVKLSLLAQICFFSSGEFMMLEKINSPCNKNEYIYPENRKGRHNK